MNALASAVTGELAALPGRALEANVGEVTKDEFRNAMALLGAAVNIITTDGPAGRAGFTASAVCSVTDTPPTLLVCVNRSTAAHGFLSKNRTLCVNTLGANGEHLSRLFSSKTSILERFSAGSWQVLQTGAPALKGAVVSFDCHIVDLRTVGSHDVLFCEVAAVSRNATEDAALVYYNRQYHEVGKVLRPQGGGSFDIIEWQ
jgi:flavin reductase